MKAIIIVIISVALGILVGYVSVKLLIVMAIMAFGIAIATAIEKEKKDFRPSIVFHKCCVTVQWVFISFYLFGADSLPADSPLKMYLIAMIPISGILYVALARNTHIILAGDSPEFMSTRNEKTNVVVALIALGIMLFFAYHLQKRVPAHATLDSVQRTTLNHPSK
jgi:hypothetical protein